MNTLRGRESVTVSEKPHSHVPNMLPSWSVTDEFLAGAREMDEHFFTQPLGQNLPVLLGAVAVWNASFLNFSTSALLPYSQALCRFPAHVQQLDMESSGKRVSVTSGEAVDLPTGPIVFGEPGTNGQHSFYQVGRFYDSDPRTVEVEVLLVRDSVNLGEHCQTSRSTMQDLHRRHYSSCRGS